MTTSHHLILYFSLLVSLASAFFSFWMAMKASDAFFELESLMAELNHEIDPLRTEEDEK
jgi:hypothetical protein